MLAQCGSGSNDLAGIPFNLVHDACALHLAVDAVGPGDDVIAGCILLVLQNIVGTEGLLVGNACCVQLCLDLVNGTLGAIFLNGSLNTLADGQRNQSAGKALVNIRVGGAGQRQTEDGESAFDVACAYAADENRAVLAVIEGETAGLVADVAGK